MTILTFFFFLAVGNHMEFFFSEGTVTNPANGLTLSATRFSYLCPQARQRFCESTRTSLAALPFFKNKLCFSGCVLFSGKVSLSKSS